jgi:heme exporter protein C
MFDFFANPTRFARLARAILPVAKAVTLVCFALGLYWGLVTSPADYQQGDTVRIMYIHVPVAWLASSSYFILALCALFFLVWRHPLADIGARAVAPVGAMFAALTLITGALWGKPTWGTYWVWDARLTSMLVLFFFFIGYMALAGGFENRRRGARPAAILALVGAINLPIVKFSVDWWNTLHQPASLLRSGGVSIDASMLWPLLTMFVGFQAFFITIVLMRMVRFLNEMKKSATARSAS